MSGVRDASVPVALPSPRHHALKRSLHRSASSRRSARVFFLWAKLPVSASAPLLLSAFAPRLWSASALPHTRRARLQHNCFTFNEQEQS